MHRMKQKEKYLLQNQDIIRKAEELHLENSRVAETITMIT